jgi:hypothetical protein
MATNDIEVEIGGLAELDLAALRQQWRTLYRSEPPPRMSRELLIRAVAFRMQEERHGGLARTTRIRLQSASVNLSKKPALPRKEHRAKPGTRFLREWNGRSHEVVATADGGYIYRGIAYRSLSAIAREITGTRWSGPAFFGLNGHRRNSDAEG